MSNIGHFPSLPVSDDDIDYGTHTLPREFWTSKLRSIREDEAYKKRRAAKSARHSQNKVNRAEENEKRRTRTR